MPSYAQKLKPLGTTTPSYVAKLKPMAKPTAPTPAAPSPLGTAADLAKGALGQLGRVVAPGPTAAFSQLGKAPGQVRDAFMGGVEQAKAGFQQANSATNPLGLIAGGTKALAGGINAAFSPLAPVMAPLGKVQSAISDKMQIPLTEEQKNSPAGQAGSKIADFVTDATTVGSAALGLKGAKPVASTVKETVAKPLGTEAPAIVSKRVGELTKLEDSYSAIRKSTAKAKEKGIDSKSLLAQTDLLHNAVDDTGTIRTQNAIHELNTFIKPHENVISANLAKEGVNIPFESVKQALTTAIDKSGLEGAALESAYTKLDSELAGLSRRADGGNISLAKIQDAKINKYSTIDYMNAGAKIADKAIARTYKTLVEDHTKSVDVKALNNELAGHYSILSLLEKLDGKKVEGGRLGKYFARTVGSIVGSHFGPLGAIAGAEIAGRLKGASMSSTFKGKTGAKLQVSEAMTKATAQSKPDYSSNSSGSRNQSQAPTAAATTKPTNMDIPESLPPKPESSNGLMKGSPGFVKNPFGSLSRNFKDNIASSVKKSLGSYVHKGPALGGKVNIAAQTRLYDLKDIAAKRPLTTKELQEAVGLLRKEGIETVK